MAEEAEHEQPEAILKRIEIILLRIALQMDIELSEAENTVAALRKRPRRSCCRHSAKSAENKAGVAKGPPEIVAPGAV
ncbi:MAG: hypothetical protein ABSC60_16570 [Acidobacteriota bacterium]|jgi:hypothetical protein